jgi:ATP-dependent DNA helicase RecG
MNLSTKLTDVKGVGKQTAKLLSGAGLITAGDLINFLPRTYEDFSQVLPIANLQPGKVTIKARCEKIFTRAVRPGMRLTIATLADDSGKVQAVWFNQPYREAQLKTGQKFFFSGQFEFQAGRYQLVSPSAEADKDLPVQAGRILPIYPRRYGLKPNITRKVLNQLRPLVLMLPETLPQEIVRQEALPSRSEALVGLHFPESAEQTETARRRLAFEELFGLILAARLSKQENLRLKGWRIPFDQPKIKQFVDNLPFTMTKSQKLALWQILQSFAGVHPASSELAKEFGAVTASSELAEKHVVGEPRPKNLEEAAQPMNRLLQGDVGSGKTVVAGAAAYQAALGGFQTAFMAPTEILAAQHAATLNNFLQVYGIEVALLTGSVKGKARKALLEQIASGQVKVVVGTHALFQPAVKFHKLGFAVIDEQHRFGVKQRQELLAKSSRLPHLLSMTATPIPRSLQLTLFGDLDISIIDELPKGRRPVATEIISPNSRAQMNEKIRQELAKGRQAYFIAPNIEESVAKSNSKSTASSELAKELSTITASSELAVEKENVENLAKKLASTFKNCQISILHGKMPAEKKEKIMGDFMSGQIQILVSTTVIEVGVDVPNATVMVVENADQFGLAQLHQLRGRVGRSQHQSFCYLVQSDNGPPTRRLNEIERSHDGFYLAEVDLKLRGAGEIYGTAQHGDLNLQIANLADTRLIRRAAAAASKFAEQISQNPDLLLQYRELAREVAKYQRLTVLN